MSDQQPPTDSQLPSDGGSVDEQSPSSSTPEESADPSGPSATPLDQAYQLLGHVGAESDRLALEQQGALRDLAKREGELQRERDEAEKRGDKTKVAQLDDELAELTRAWRVATEDTDEGTS